MNGRPQAGELVYVIVTEGLEIRDVFRRPPIELADHRLDEADWNLISIPMTYDHPGKLTLFRIRKAITLLPFIAF